MSSMNIDHRPPSEAPRAYRPQTRPVTMTQAADWLGVSRQTLYALVNSGAIKRVQLTPSIARIDLNTLHEKVEQDTGLPTDRSVPLALQTMSQREVAERLHISIDTLRSMIRSDRIRESVFSKRVRLINSRAIDALVGNISEDDANTASAETQSHDA